MSDSSKHSSTMTQKVKVTYSSPGLQPPVYFAGSLGEQPWQPIEMQHTKKADGEHDFWQEFDVEQGEYQYKFRLGPGDWWVLDETKHIVDDGAGNRNNLLLVQPQSPKDSLLDLHAKKEVHAPATTVEHERSTEHPNTIVTTTQDNMLPHELPQPERPSQEGPQVDSEQAPAFPHEAASSLDTMIVNAIPDDQSEEHIPLCQHESVAAASSEPTEFEVTDEDDEDDHEDQEMPSPLFRHESLAPIRTHEVRDDDEEYRAPLFRHESMSPREEQAHFSARSARSDSTSSYVSHHYDVEDINDPSLEIFPTECDDILLQLQRAGSRHQDEDAILELPSPLSSTRSLSAAASPSLSLTKESSEHLDCIDESEELSIEDAGETQGLGIESTNEPLVTAVIPSRDIEPSVERTEEFVSKFPVSSKQEPVNRGPLTPPMTPIDEPQTKGGAHDGTVDDSKFEWAHLKAPSSPRDRKDNSTDNIASRSTSKSSLGSSHDKDGHAKMSSFWGWVGKICGGRVGTMGIAVAVGIAAAFYAVTGKTSKA